MSIPGKQIINIGLANEPTGSDSLFDAFTKTKVNFDTLFENASPFNNFVASSGIDVSTNANAGIVTITNTGVTALTPGTGIVLSGSNGNITISSTGGAGNGGGTVTSIGVLPVSTSRITTSGSPIVSSGNIFLDLATTGVAAGTYSNPIVTLDAYGRVLSAANGATTGTVTSVGLSPGQGIGISGGPVTSSGNITVTNTGVTRITAGTGITLSSGNGNVTISTTSLGGTVTSVGVSSSQLVVTGSPVVNSGTIGINLPNSASFSGNVAADRIIANEANIDGNLVVTGNISPAGPDKIGGIKPGPGVNITLGGELTIDTANLPLSFGNFTANTNVLSIVNVDEDMVLQTQGNAEIQLIGDIGFYKPDGLPPNVANRYFSATGDGQIRITTPNVDPLLGAVEIVGSTSGNVLSPQTTGAMLHVTGQQDTYSAILLDSIGNTPFFASRRFNGNVDTPTQVLNGETTLVVGVSPYGNGGFPSLTTGHLQWNAVGNQTSTNRGSNIEVYTTPANSNVLIKTATFTGNTTQCNNLEVSGVIDYNRVYGSFRKTANVTFASAETVFAFDWFADTTPIANVQGVVVNEANPTRIVIEQSGAYQVLIELQAKNTSNQERFIWVWLAKNGTDLPLTTKKISLIKELQQLVTKQWIVSDVTANDYLEARYAVSSTTGISLEYNPEQTTPFIMPAQSSASITVCPVGA